MTSVIIEKKDFKYNDVIKISFKNAGHTIANEIIKGKSKLPKEDILFLFSCVGYKLKDYIGEEKK